MHTVKRWSGIRIGLGASVVAVALLMGSSLGAQQTTTSGTSTPDPISQTTAVPAPNTPMSKAELKAQKKQEKQQEKAADANAKAAKAQAKAKKDQDNALQQQEKAVGTLPKN